MADKLTRSLLPPIDGGIMTVSSLLQCLSYVLFQAWVLPRRIREDLEPPKEHNYSHVSLSTKLCHDSKLYGRCCA